MTIEANRLSSGQACRDDLAEESVLGANDASNDIERAIVSMGVGGRALAVQKFARRVSRQHTRATICRFRAQGERRGDPGTCQTCLCEFWTRSWHLQDGRGHARSCRPGASVTGILGLRVADASVMPQIITGPGTNASTHMIAGRAAELIRPQNDNRELHRQASVLLTIDTHHHMLPDFFWRETDDADAPVGGLTPLCVGRFGTSCHSRRQRVTPCSAA